MQDFRRMFPKVEAIFLLAVYGGVFPILCFLIGWWGSIPFLPEPSIKYAALIGFLLGILIDILFLRRWIARAYDMPLVWLGLIYIFYSAGIFGFFMGVPVFNVLLGIFAGFYMGLRMAQKNVDETLARKVFKRTGMFTAVVLFVICCAALWMAFMDASLAANINGMLALQAPLSRNTILILSSVGGVTAVALEYYLTRWFAMRAFR